MDTDGDEQQEWLAFYQYDVKTAGQGKKVTRMGPYGAAIYDPNRCRPPAIPSYELAPVSYDYLGQDAANATVEKMITYNDPLSGGLDRPEVLITGSTGYIVTTSTSSARRELSPIACRSRAGLTLIPVRPFRTMNG